MSCDGHLGHYYEPVKECRYCGHDRSEHDEEGFWEDDRDHPKAPEPVEARPTRAGTDNRHD